MTDPAACRIWLNGQRLRPDAEAGAVAAYRVSELLRQGANCLAIESRSDADTIPVAVSLGGNRLKKISCRMKVTQPPVGWQKTDFNHKDWKTVERQLASVEWSRIPFTALKKKQTASRMQDGRFRFHDDDHVVLLGGTFIERAQKFGHLEAALMSSNATGLTFRNLGWSADTVFAESRGIFDRPAKGYARMIEHLRAEEPDVVLVQYGQNEAMQEMSGSNLVEFQQQLQKLISDIKVTTPEVVLVTPHPLLKNLPPLPDASMWNPALQRYSQAVQAVAEKTGCPCVDLFEGFEGRLVEAAETVGRWRPGMIADEHPDLKAALLRGLTDNGMHWNDLGYRCISSMFAQALFGDAQRQLTVTIDEIGGAQSVTVASAAKMSVTPKMIKIQLNAPWLRSGVLIVDTSQTQANVSSVSKVWEERQVPLVEADMTEPSTSDGPKRVRYQFTDDYDRLVNLLIRKNELYFHRWRPQNITYLFGFRKHEQGNNAAEIAEFDPLIVDYEKQIQVLLHSAGPTIRLELE
ncbi:MAG: GDSL-type esterase/lipase family protein [Fuerstiella sp.]